jgi:hypothetical protein
MKINKLFGLLMILASAFLFVNCTSDPVPGPPGADGVDGIDGVDGADGVDGTASCVSCHNNTLRSEIESGFAVSLHLTGDTWPDRGAFAGGACAKCHSGQGYPEFIESGEITSSGSDLEVPMSCNSCHSNHNTFDFENDGPDYALRNTAPTVLDLAPSISLDFGDASNNCITCHQPRPADIPAINPDGTYEITSIRFGPHHSPQSTMLEGILGAEITGPFEYPARASAAHRTNSSCVQCHMGESEDPEIGGHSWNHIESNCITCHGAVPGSSNSYINDYPELFALLRQVKGTDPDGNPITGIVYEEFDEDDEGILVRSVYSTPGVWPDVAAMAAWNYKTVYEDQSRGIHNPKYTEALLKNSIQAVQELLNQD